MKNIQIYNNDPESGPKSFFELLIKLVFGDEKLKSIVKFALMGGAGIYVVLVVWRIWLISHALTMFGMDITDILPIDPNTAAIIHKGLILFMLFAPEEIIAYILINRDAKYWRAWTAVALVCAAATSWWVTHEPGLGTHCYVITPDRGLIKTYADKNGKCGIDRSSGLQMSLVTQEILLCIRAMEQGLKPHRLAVSAINSTDMFDSGDGHSLYWFHQNTTNGLDFYDNPGFDQATLTPLTPVKPENAERIGQYIRQQQEAAHISMEKAAAKAKAEAERKQAQAAKEKAIVEQKQARAEQEAQRQAAAAEYSRREAENNAQLAKELLEKAEEQRRIADEVNKAGFERQREINEMNAKREEEFRRQQALAVQREEQARKQERYVQNQINARQQQYMNPLAILQQQSMYQQQQRPIIMSPIMPLLQQNMYRQ